MSPSTASGSYQGGNRLIIGVVLAVITFWLFAQTTLNISAVMRADLGISENLNNIAVSITALFSGIFIVIAGSLADRLGRVRLTNCEKPNVAGCAAIPLLCGGPPLPAPSPPGQHARSPARLGLQLLPARAR